jgi:ribosomal protein S27E
VTARLRRALVVTLLAAALAGCGGGSNGGGSNGGTTAVSSATSCDLAGCTITFPRGGNASVSAFGVEARLVGVDKDSARIAVAGQTISVPVGGTKQVQGFTVGVQRVTDSEVVVRVSR